MKITFEFEGRDYEANVTKVKTSAPDFFISLKNQDLINRFGSEHLLHEDGPGRFGFGFPDSTRSGKDFMYKIAKALSDCLKENGHEYPA